MLKLPTPLNLPPPDSVSAYNPFPNLAPIPLDERRNRIGIAQTVARGAKVQARILWIDATANLDRINSEDKMRTVLARAKNSGFNTVVLDVKPIVGETLYPSRYAPKLTQWIKPGVNYSMPAEFDALAAFVKLCRQIGLSPYVSLNAFAEGHRDMKRGLAYQHPEWQTILYEEQAVCVGMEAGGNAPKISLRPNEIPDDATQIAVYTDTARLLADLPRRGDVSLVLFLDANNRIAAQMLPAAVAATSVAIPNGGSAMVAFTSANEVWMKANWALGSTARIASTAAFVPIGERPKRQVPVITNPYKSEVRQRILAMITEIATGYDIDGMLFDDRLRFAGIDADFSPEMRSAFTAWVKKPVRFPDDIYRVRYSLPDLDRTFAYGDLFDAFLLFRAQTIRNFVADAAFTLKKARPNAIFGTYVGSWYPDYPDVGANWGSPDLFAGFRFLSEGYTKTGWANLCDVIVAGTYYRTGTIADATSKGVAIGESVEAAGQTANRIVNDNAWTIAAVQLSDYEGRPDDLLRALTGACAATQGVMVFDLSHKIEAFWPIFAKAFVTETKSPLADAKLLEAVRKTKADNRAKGILPLPVVIYRGTSGTGF